MHQEYLDEMEGKGTQYNSSELDRMKVILLANSKTSNGYPDFPSVRKSLSLAGRASSLKLKNLRKTRSVRDLKVRNKNI